VEDRVAAHADGATVRLSVVPRAQRTGVADRHGGALKLKVQAPPVDGAANDEVCRFLAAHVGVRASDVSILTGTRGRDKVALVRGVSADVLRRALGQSRPCD
jgi:uncharacterized protein (TIGR00251 family)